MGINDYETTPITRPGALTILLGIGVAIYTVFFFGIAAWFAVLFFVYKDPLVLYLVFWFLPLTGAMVFSAWQFTQLNLRGIQSRITTVVLDLVVFLYVALGGVLFNGAGGMVYGFSGFTNKLNGTGDSPAQTLSLDEEYGWFYTVYPWLVIVVTVVYLVHAFLSIWDLIYQASHIAKMKSSSFRVDPSEAIYA